MDLSSFYLVFHFFSDIKRVELSGVGKMGGHVPGVGVVREGSGCWPAPLGRGG